MSKNDISVTTEDLKNAMKAKQVCELACVTIFNEFIDKLSDDVDNSLNICVGDHYELIAGICEDFMDHSLANYCAIIIKPLVDKKIEKFNDKEREHYLSDIKSLPNRYRSAEQLRYATGVTALCAYAVLHTKNNCEDMFDQLKTVEVQELACV